MAQKVAIKPDTLSGYLERPSSRLRKRVSITFSQPSRTKQAFKEECDINTILKRYQTSGALPSLIKENPQYGDFSSPLSYQDSLNLVLHAETQFNSLSSHVRERFNNDPKQFLEFTANSKNLPEMVQLGLAIQRQIQNDDKIEPNQTNSKQSKKSADSKLQDPT